MSGQPLPPVVLLHGLATSAARTWGETGWIDLLGDEDRHCFAIELPGHRGPTDSTDPEDYRGFEDQVLAMFPDEQCDVIGFSLGARTAALIAARHPDRIRRLVLAGVGANLFRSEGHGAVLADALEALDAGSTPEPAELATVANHFAQLARSCGLGLGPVAAVLRRPDATPLDPMDLATVSASTLVALGDRDPAGPADPLMGALSDATLITLRNTDHSATPRSMALIGAALGHLSAAD